MYTKIVWTEMFKEIKTKVKIHTIWELIAIKHTEVQPGVFEHEHKLHRDQLSFK